VLVSIAIGPTYPILPRPVTPLLVGVGVLGQPSTYEIGPAPEQAAGSSAALSPVVATVFNTVLIIAPEIKTEDHDAHTA
jgi:hypothetical protein